ncbi:L-rhamnose mutarotase [Photobacterium sp. ZSDE20]|uniref:L-rhamnose mutarotase n=1 Tax=Photobacterium pectinilyticum TaxID=2906793 RepID=A0ABT1N4I1_9GAMM|nr:L-rhamnose mutarotase [Photobacterium sp. ZSDE20]MCQ1059641.1 L-rhamnose mutarotase [Photobacterium sp. ZSDE20]MDD1825845.1 L-rhamnose mutarotase [Photobacterium sp. ZSDE20]
MASEKIRKASIMQLRPGFAQEYQRRHDEIWPELAATLRQHGASNYSIFLEKKTSQLFAYVEIESEFQWQQIAKTQVCKEWWHYMQDIMETNPDTSPCSIELSSVFYLA